MVTSVMICHDNKIIHRDIKLENFLVKEDKKSKDLMIKLADFGIACNYDVNDPPTIKCGTISGLPPEMLMQETYCPKVDCWSLGVILYELLTSIHPFHSEENSESINNIRDEEIDFDNPAIWQNVSI